MAPAAVGDGVAVGRPGRQHTVDVEVVAAGRARLTEQDAADGDGGVGAAGDDVAGELRPRGHGAVELDHRRRRTVGQVLRADDLQR